MACAGRSMPAMRTLGLVRAAGLTTWAAVIIRPFPRYTPRPGPHDWVDLAGCRLRKGARNRRWTARALPNAAKVAAAKQHETSRLRTLGDERSPFFSTVDQPSWQNYHEGNISS